MDPLEWDSLNPSVIDKEATLCLFASSNGDWDWMRLHGVLPSFCLDLIANIFGLLRSLMASYLAVDGTAKYMLIYVVGWTKTFNDDASSHLAAFGHELDLLTMLG
ncbi:hypothetical protein Ancab_011766 [Ancistrocladus abbreviatus]